MFPTSEEMDGHACAFFKYNNVGFILLPNLGLYSSTSRTVIAEWMSHDEAVPGDDAPSIAMADLVKW